MDFTESSKFSSERRVKLKELKLTLLANFDMQFKAKTAPTKTKKASLKDTFTKEPKLNSLQLQDVIYFVYPDGQVIVTGYNRQN